jgi:hypothetical protein
MMLHLVCEKKLRPSEAFDEMRRRESEEFRQMLEAVATAFASGSLVPRSAPATSSGGFRGSRGAQTTQLDRMTGNKLGDAPKPPSGAGRGKRPKAVAKRPPKKPKKGISRKPEAERGSIAGRIAEKIWEIVLSTPTNKKKFTVTFVDPISKKKKTVNVVPDFMPTGRQDATGRYINADQPNQALVIADSKYTWDIAKKVALDDRSRACSS